MVINQMRIVRYLAIVFCLMSVGFMALMRKTVQEEAKLHRISPEASVRDPTQRATEYSKHAGQRKSDEEDSSAKHISSVYEQVTETVPIRAEEKLAHLINITQGHPRRKNVLFIMSDDLRPQLGSYWNRHFPNPFTNLRPHTPHLDRLASSSLLLTRAYVQYSLCGPSRASMLTGRRPDTVTTWKLETKFREVQRNFTTLPQYFKDNGYISINLGKIFHQGHGWTNDYLSWDIPHPDETNSFQDLYKSRLLHRYPAAGQIVPEERAGDMLSPDESLTLYSVNYLRRLAPRAKSGNINFFLGVGYHRPHLPWICSKEFFDLYPMDKMDLPRDINKYYPADFPLHNHQPHLELLKHALNITTHEPNEILPDNETMYYRRAYFACVSFVDDMVGILLDEVEKLGLGDSTIIMFLGDHGWHLGENGLWGKRTTFEQSNHTPLMIKVPGLTDKGIVSDSLVEFIDVFPTLVEVAGLPPAPPCPQQSRDTALCTEGTSFLPLVNKPDTVLKPAALSQLYHDGKMGYSIKTERYRYTEWVPLEEVKVNESHYDYHILWDRVTGTELYDHLTDPEENFNLANLDKHKYVVDEHSKMLKELIPEAISGVNFKLI